MSAQSEKQPDYFSLSDRKESAYNSYHSWWHPNEINWIDFGALLKKSILQIKNNTHPQIRQIPSKGRGALTRERNDIKNIDFSMWSHKFLAKQHKESELADETA